ncbi:hypothetical protein HDE_10420 [Halotydeus destructor]|nr:hypothetical protein HDE_10420 [Halotydeus destructor]
MQLQLVTWIIAFESAMSRVADSGLNLIENLKTKQIKALVEGLELALLTSQLVRNFIFLHLHFGKAMSRQNIVHICRLLNVLKTIEVSFDRKKGVLLQISNSYAQYNSLLALEALSSMKKRLLADVTKYSEKKLDTLSAVILASNCINGPILTESRQIITAICLAFIGNAMTDADSSRILGSFRKIEQTSKVLSLLKWNTSTEFLYFNRNIIGTFYSHLHEHGNIREIRYFSLVLEDCLNFLHFSTEYDEVRQKLLKSTFEEEMATAFKDQFLTKFCTAFETELRLQTHLELKLDDRSPFKRPLFDFASPLSCEPFRLLDRFVSIRNVVQDHLSEMTYNLTTIALHDWKTYESILNLSRTKYGLNFVASQLPTQTLEQGLDVLEITRKIDVFVSRYLYNLNNQMFIEKSSDNKHLNVLLIRHVANSIQTHGFGIINTAVNFTYQFLRKKVHIFSQFLFDEHVKSRLLKDLRFFRESKSSKFPYERAEKFVKDIRKLGLTPDGLSFLDQFRQVITEIGNALGFVRMLRSGALHCSSASVAFVPDVEELSDISFEAMATEEHFTGECLQAAQNLDSVLKTLNSNFGEATDFFKVLVDVFVTLRDQKNFYHLKNFHIILPALTVNYVEWSVMSKEKMNRKNKNGAQFTDDGFEMGVAYLLCLLEQFTEFESVHWFGSVREKITIERNEAIKEKNAIQTVNQLSDKLRQTTSLTLKRLDVLQNEFDLLNYNLTACKILFSGSITK